MIARRRQRGVGGRVNHPPAPYRDHLLQPYDNTSVWNTPLGDAADEVAADLPVAFTAAGKVSIDEIQLAMDTGAPVKAISNGTLVNNVTKPALPDASKLPADAHCRMGDTIVHDSTWNGITGALHDTDDTLAYTGQPLYRPTSADDPKMYFTAGSYPTAIRGLDDLYGNGRKGAHGGGSLGGIGGTIRAWEYDQALSDDYLINHRLALNVHALNCLSRVDNALGSGLSGPGWRWPAFRADAEFNQVGASGYYGRTGVGYDGVVMGSLLGLPLGYDLSGISDKLAYSIGWALLHFGAHITDSTGNARYAFSCENSRKTAWLARSTSTFHPQLMTPITDLVLIDDCTPDTPGGTGSPRTTAPLPLTPR